MRRPRLFTSHFVLLPDGSLGKWPVVELGADGRILSLELHPEGLRERPGMELLGGLLLPGLLDVAGSASFVFGGRDLNRHYAGGTYVLGGCTEAESMGAVPLVVKGVESEMLQAPVLRRRQENFQLPLLSRLDAYMAVHPEGDWLGILHAATALAAEAAGLELGRVEVGACPGLLLLKGLDLGGMKWRGRGAILRVR
ncbi:hypothetical protein [Geofilum rhodophaeum]|uniref:hypothetical protein n=1 Tax=Geofilum rhodophaeum TaxID=1965019 RepID=UPI0011BA57D0|nr:hypothetical protein [Geofilum rhodophaeum]